MARTITEIKQDITTFFMANETLAAYYGYTAGANFDETFSKASLESVMFYIVAFAIFVVESLFYVLKTEVNTALEQRLTHNRQWYVNIAKAFQYGDALNENTGKYDLVDESKMVVNFAAVDEIAGQLFLKIATSGNDGLSALPTIQETAFKSYIQSVKDAGVRVTIINELGDDLRLVLDIFYDPMVLGDNGQLLDGGGEPVKDTIRNFIKTLPFNGEFKSVALVDALQLTSGVIIPTVLSAESKYAANDWAIIDARVKPNAGYLVIADENLTINYRPYDAN